MDLSKSLEFFQPNKYKDRIHIVGCGSVGSTVAVCLARCGITNFTLWDLDIVVPHNMANQMFRRQDIGRPKVEALAEILSEINEDIEPKIKLKPEGWQGETLSGFVFLCVDSVEIRREIVEKHLYNLNVKAMFDFRTRLTDAQHYAADWMDMQMKQDLLSSMQFSHDEAADDTPVSACGVTLGVAPTVWDIVTKGVANFMNFWNGKPIKKLILSDTYNFVLDAF